MNRILACLDDTALAPVVLAAAAKLARSTAACLVPFRVVGLPYGAHPPAEIFEVAPELLPDVWKRQALGALEELVADVSPALREPAQVAIGVPWDAICRAARELAVDLIVIGAHRYHGVDRLLGTTSAKVVNHADRPVLVVR